MEIRQTDSTQFFEFEDARGNHVLVYAQEGSIRFVPDGPDKFLEFDERSFSEIFPFLTSWFVTQKRLDVTKNRILDTFERWKEGA